MKSTNADEKSCREALIESRGNRRWAEQIIHAERERAAAAAAAAAAPELDEAALASKGSGSGRNDYL